jgi:hypothetical protein
MLPWRDSVKQPQLSPFAVDAPYGSAPANGGLSNFESDCPPSGVSVRHPFGRPVRCGRVSRRAGARERHLCAAAKRFAVRGPQAVLQDEGHVAAHGPVGFFEGEVLTGIVLVHERLFGVRVLGGEPQARELRRLLGGCRIGAWAVRAGGNVDAIRLGAAVKGLDGRAPGRCLRAARGGRLGALVATSLAASDPAHAARPSTTTIRAAASSNRPLPRCMRKLCRSVRILSAPERVHGNGTYEMPSAWCYGPGRRSRQPGQSSMSVPSSAS